MRTNIQRLLCLLMVLLLTLGGFATAFAAETLPGAATDDTIATPPSSQPLTPIQTNKPAMSAPEDEESTEDIVIEVELTDDEAATDAPENTPHETIGDPEKDHEPMAAMYEDEAVDVIQLGVVRSIILANGQRQEVDTALLTFGEEIPEEKKLGYVHAPRTGQAGLRETPAKGGKVITQLKAGQLFAVLALEEDYALINVQGTEGWLRLDCLRYLEETDSGFAAVSAQPSAANAQQNGNAAEEADPDEVAISGDMPTPPDFPTKALLSLNGETDGPNNVNLRNLPTKESAKAAAWRIGTSITLLSWQDGWYLVEADGVLGYVMEDFISFEG